MKDVRIVKSSPLSVTTGGIRGVDELKTVTRSPHSFRKFGTSPNYYYADGLGKPCHRELAILDRRMIVRRIKETRPQEYHIDIV